jgi:membrane-associated phospholipid phosphatase
MKKRIISEIIVAFLAFSMSYLATGLITDITKNLYGRPRPDFLSRCYGPKGISDQEKYWITLPSKDPLRANSMTNGQKEALALYNSSRAEPHVEYNNGNNISFPYIEDIGPIIEWYDCINDGKKLMVKEGRRSFPSGHTSFIFAGAMFCALYSGYWLGTWRSSLALGLGSKSRNFPGVSAKLATVFVFLLPAIYVGASRTQDYRHHPSDVIAGAIIGSVTTFITFFQYYSYRRMWR